MPVHVTKNDAYNFEQGATKTHLVIIESSICAIHYLIGIYDTETVVLSPDLLPVPIFKWVQGGSGNETTDTVEMQLWQFCTHSRRSQ